MSAPTANDYPIYLDHAATTPVDSRVIDAMLPWLGQNFGNPASRTHVYGWEAEEAVERARSQVAALINADSREIVWTSGATESDNLAIKGAAQFYGKQGKHIITVKTEHKAVLDTCRELERRGFEVTYLDVQEDGLIDLDVFRASLRPDTILVSVMFVNSEIGVIQDIATLGELCRANGDDWRRHSAPSGRSLRKHARWCRSFCLIAIFLPFARPVKGKMGALFPRRPLWAFFDACLLFSGAGRVVRKSRACKAQSCGCV